MKLLRYYRFFLWVIVIAVLCFTPGNELREVEIDIPHLDKVIHLIMFYILGLLIQGIQGISKTYRLILIATSTIYAGLIEIVQYQYIYMRSGDVYDLLFDEIGLLLGLITYKLYPKILKKLLQ